ncbi:unnamed protein product [Lactuca virosa]|uniref:Dynamin-type G domain-containing protein n=1 Tax=Lactuca virosa TaxID=75947 RepID=A0AAU9PH80_9ASTR|nr:unnamed protein product [Lactuca virosa]
MHLSWPMADNNQGTTSISPPLFSSYNDKIRPIIDTIDKLRSLKVIEQGIPDPTIIVAGENYSGKASVIESLVGIFPPFAREACSKVPLIMRLQNHQNPAPEFVLKYQKKSVRIMKEKLISEAINQATLEIAGIGKTIPNVPLTLLVKKKGIPNLTITYLPGKYWYSTSEDKSRDNFEHISDITKGYINPKESIILNVSSARSRLPSIRTSHRVVDTREERTLAVITKCDEYHNIDLSKAISENKFKIRNRYHFIRNRINDETHEEARIQETTLFESSHLLSKIEKSMVGIPALATRLAKIHLVIILRCLPDIVKKINEGIYALDLELNQLPKNSMSIPDALTAFMHMVGSFKVTLQNILIKGEYDHEYIDEKQMHCNPRLVQMLDEFSKKLNSVVKFSENFLVEELDVLNEANGIWSSLFVPHSAVLCFARDKTHQYLSLSH